MPLRRITLSGRFGRPQEDDDVRRIVIRGLFFMGLDIAITLSVSITLFFAFAG
uniref:RDD family protein n=1 Tax=Heterorhabditis bacteriophora TaxID=37862 RepID=A0A1I7X444_HETBA